MNNQLEWTVPGDFLSPSNDIFLGIVVEITVVKRRWVERIEQLLQLAQVDVNSSLRGRRFVHSRVGHFFLPSRRFFLLAREPLLASRENSLHCQVQALDIDARLTENPEQATCHVARYKCFDVRRSDAVRLRDPRLPAARHWLG